MRDRENEGRPRDEEITRETARELEAEGRVGSRADQPVTKPRVDAGGRELQHVTEAREPVLPRVEEAGSESLFGDGETRAYRSRWESIQASFVDEPRRAVEEADSLVRDLTSQITDVFTRQRSSLEQQWDRGGEVSTEDLRIALQRYRDYLNRLLKL